MKYVNQFFDPDHGFGKCTICHSPEHLRRYCPTEPSAGAPWPDCPICQLGHSKAKCPLAGCCTLCFERAHDAQRCPHRPYEAPAPADWTASAPMPVAGRAVESVAEATPVGPQSLPLPLTSNRRKDKQCYNCSQFGHTRAECPGKRQSEQEALAAAEQPPPKGKDGDIRKGPVCHLCRERGHVKADCSNRREAEAPGPNAGPRPQPRTSREADGTERSADRAAESRRDSSAAAAGEAKLVDGRLLKWEKVSFRQAEPELHYETLTLTLTLT